MADASRAVCRFDGCQTVVSPARSVYCNAHRAEMRAEKLPRCLARGCGRGVATHSHRYPGYCLTCRERKKREQQSVSQTATLATKRAADAVKEVARIEAILARAAVERLYKRRLAQRTA